MIITAATHHTEKPTIWHGKSWQGEKKCSCFSIILAAHPRKQEQIHHTSDWWSFISILWLRFEILKFSLRPESIFILGRFIYEECVCKKSIQSQIREETNEAFNRSIEIWCKWYMHNIQYENSLLIGISIGHPLILSTAVYCVHPPLQFFVAPFRLFCSFVWVFCSILVYKFHSEKKKKTWMTTKRGKCYEMCVSFSVCVSVCVS